MVWDRIVSYLGDTMSRDARWVALAATLAWALPIACPRDAEGQTSLTEDGVALDVAGACPEVAAVRRLLAALVTADEAQAAVVSVQDQGPHYRIAVRSQATTLDDPARDCAARARQAAIVAASGLRSHRQVFGPPMWTIEKGLVFDVAPTAAGAVWAPGAELRSAYGSGLWSLVGAAGARGPVTLSGDNGWKADLLRFPLDVGARMTSYRWRLRPWLGLGPSVTVTGILGKDLVQTDRKWRLDPGALALVGATLPIKGRIGVAAAINARWQPRPYHLQVTPVGTVADTPTWWLGLSLNYTLDGKPSSP
jgi:hypothetical protein